MWRHYIDRLDSFLLLRILLFQEGWWSNHYVPICRKCVFLPTIDKGRVLDIIGNRVMYWLVSALEYNPQVQDLVLFIAVFSASGRAPGMFSQRPGSKNARGWPNTFRPWKKHECFPPTQQSFTFLVTNVLNVKFRSCFPLFSSFWKFPGEGLKGCFCFAFNKFLEAFEWHKRFF